MSNSVYYNADIVIKHINTQGVFNFYELRRASQVSPDEFSAAIDQLQKDGFIDQKYSDSPEYYVTGEGRDFISNKGYATKNLLDREEKKLQKDAARDASKLTKASIKNIPIARVISIIAILLTVTIALSRGCNTA